MIHEPTNPMNPEIKDILAKLNDHSFKTLLLNEIWRIKRKNGGYDYILVEDMSPYHLKRSVKNAKKELDSLIMEILEKEVDRRINLGNKIIKKLNNINSKMENDKNTDEPQNINSGDAKIPAESNESAKECFNPKIKAIFQKGESIKTGHTVDDVICTNGQGYSIKLKSIKTGEITYIPQSKLIIKLKRLASKSEADNKNQQKKVAPTKTDIVRKYEIGDLVGNKIVLDWQSSNKGFYGGFRYKVKNKDTGKVSFVKQSRLKGRVTRAFVKNTNPQPQNIHFEYQPVSITPSNSPVLPESPAELPKLSRLAKIIMGLKTMIS